MPDYPGKKILELVRRLTTATEAGQAKWQRTDTATAFTYTGATSSVVVASKDTDGWAPFVLTLLDSAGAEVEKVESDTRWDSEYETSFVTSTPWNDKLEHLYTVARRSALNIDDVVDSLLADLPPDPEPF